MKFLDKRTNEIKLAYSIENGGEKVLVKFTAEGKVYKYNRDNIEILDESQRADSHIIYQIKQQCYKCRAETAIYTYIVFSDGTDEDVTFPWDKERLLRGQNIFAHLEDPSIEYYGLKVIGGNKELDELLMKEFPDKIKPQYSKTQNRVYPMNLCEHCRAKQGEYFIYRQINEAIKNMEKITVKGYTT